MKPIDQDLNSHMINLSSTLSARCKDARDSLENYTIGEIKDIIEDSEDLLLEIAGYLEDLT